MSLMLDVPLDLILCSFVLGLFFLHLWFYRKNLAQIPESLKEAWHPEISLELFREMECNRMRRVSVMSTGGCWMLICGLALLAIMVASQSLTADADCFALAVFGSVAYIFSLLGQRLASNPLVNDSFCLLAATLSILRTVAVNDMSNFELGGSMRVLTRLFFGLIIVDRRKFLLLNLIGPFLTCVRYQPIDEHRRTLFICVELLGLILCLGISTVVQASFLAQAQSVLDVRTSTSSSQAVQKMLSVLCDAEVRLGPEMQIVEPSNKAVHYLSCHDVFPSADIGRQSLDGLDFKQFVHADDLQRFLNFLQPPDEPPASITLKLQNLSASTFRRAELFQVSIPDLMGSASCRGHLLGIRYMTEGVEIANTSSIQEQEAFQRQGEISQSADTQGRDSRPGGSLIQSRSANEDAASDSASSSSAPSVAHRRPLPELLGISVTCDALTPRFTVRQVVFDFEELAPSSSASQLPQLADWMFKDTWDLFIVWAQTEMNRGTIHNSNFSTYPGRLEIFMPAASGNDQRLLEGEKATLCLTDTSLIEDDDEDDSMLVTLRIERFTEILAMRARRRKHARQQRIGTPCTTSQTCLLPIHETHVNEKTQATDAKCQ